MSPVLSEVDIPVSDDDSATVTFVPAASSSITIVKKAISGSGTFTFVSSTPALAISLTTGDIVSSGPKALAPGSYSVTELQNVPFFYLADIACNDPDGGTSTSVANATAVIERFLHHRLTALLDDEPDRPRFLRRFPGSLWGGGGSGGANSTPFNLAMTGTDGKASFSTSLGQIVSAMAGADQRKQQQAMSLGSAALYERPGAAPYRGVDIWTEAHFTAFEDDIGNGNADGDFDILYVGADIRSRPTCWSACSASSTGLRSTPSSTAAAPRVMGGWSGPTSAPVSTSTCSSTGAPLGANRTTA